MEGQLKVAGNQSTILGNQAEISREQKELMAKQLDAMTSQVEVMERTLKAAQDSVTVAWDALKIEKRAYLGISRLNIDLKKTKRLALQITNIGKTPADNIAAKIQVTIASPRDWLQPPPENVRIFALGEEDYNFYLTSIYPNSIPVVIGFALGSHFSDEELALVAQKKSVLTVNLSLDYQSGIDKEFSYFVLTYRGKDTRGYDSWGISPTESEKQNDQANPEHPEWKNLY
jgi:hypothetical protein